MRTPTPTAVITIAGQKLGGSATALLPRTLRCELGMDGVGRCSMVLIVPTGTRIPAPGAPLRVELGFDGATAPVFSGEVDSVRTTALGVTVSAGDALARLANTFAAGTYEALPPGPIVRDLLDQAGVAVGAIDDGPHLGSHVLFPGLSLLDHLQRLAALCGASLFADGEGALHFIAADTVGATHSFRFGADVLALDLAHAPTTRSGVDVWGEGAAGTQGEAKAHWLPDALDGVAGRADLDGAPVFASPAVMRRSFVRDGSLRTGNAAAEAARGRAAALARPLCGTLDVPGAPRVAPGDLVELTGLPESHPLHALLAAGRLRVRRVRHRLDTARGFTTRMEF